MKIIIVAHGKIKKGPELELIADYVTRFNKQFNNDFLTSLEISESNEIEGTFNTCLLYTSPSPRDLYRSRMPSSA